MFRFLRFRDCWPLFIMPFALAAVWAVIELQMGGVIESYLNGLPYYPPSIEEAVSEENADVTMSAMDCKVVIDATDDSAKTIYWMLMRGVRILFVVGLLLIIMLCLSFMETISGLRKELDSPQQKAQ